MAHKMPIIYIIIQYFAHLQLSRAPGRLLHPLGHDHTAAGESMCQMCQQKHFFAIPFPRFRPTWSGSSSRCQWSKWKKFAIFSLPTQTVVLVNVFGLIHALIWLPQFISALDPMERIREWSENRHGTPWTIHRFPFSARRIRHPHSQWMCVDHLIAYRIEKKLIKWPAMIKWKDWHPRSRQTTAEEKTLCICIKHISVISHLPILVSFLTSPSPQLPHLPDDCAIPSSAAFLCAHQIYWFFPNCFEIYPLTNSTDSL